MKIISLKCPHCEAPLQINSELSRAFCNYCGNSFVIEDELRSERKAGYEYERGRMEAQDDGAEEVLRRLRELVDPLAELDRLNARLGALRLEKQIAKVRLKTLQNPLWKLLPPLIGGLCMGISILTMIFGGTGRQGLLAGVLLLALGILGGYIGKWYSASKGAQVEEQIRAAEDREQEAKERIERLRTEYDFDYLPEKYREPEALDFLIEVLQGRRATTLAEALNLYEEELHRRQMREIQEEQLRVQREQLETQRRQLEAQQEQTGALQEMEENRKAEAAGKILGTVISAGIGVMIGKGIGKFLDDL